MRTSAGEPCSTVLLLIEYLDSADEWLRHAADRRRTDHQPHQVLLVHLVLLVPQPDHVGLGGGQACRVH